MADRDVDFGPVYDHWEGDIDWGMSEERSIWATWTYSRRAIIYSDEAMTNQIGVCRRGKRARACNSRR